ncbi:N-acetylglucosamine kinase [Streptomyces gamaensis]|uniref:N-acetylglucosamine kinase n=1 Tax=Streptomyces gamaensis TaxID=1763542 RepID=A0ABW0Z3B5_9ACTN
MNPRGPDDGAAAAGHVLAVDSGGSGVRVAVAPVSGGGPVAAWSSATPLAVGAEGIDAHGLLSQVLPAAEQLLRQAGAEECAAACVGAAGMAALGGQLRAVLPAALRSALGVRRLALATDAVTAYAGALGQRPGAAVAAGTGVIALGTGPGTGGWRRADGWGHLLGDCGSGAWIGRAGLEAALRAYDGRAGGSAALLARLEAVFGPAPDLPAMLYPRTDRPAVLASFAPEVARCAPDDPVAAGILREAARHIVSAAAAVCPRQEAVPAASGRDPASNAPAADAPGTAEVAFTGGLFRVGEPLLAPLRRELREQLPWARLVAASGEPLDGALRVAAALVTDALLLPVDGTLLSVVR